MSRPAFRSILPKALALAMGTLLAFPALSAEILRLGNITDPNHSETKAQMFFAERVAELTNGEVRVEIFSSGQLGDAPSQLEAIRLGAQDMYGGGSGNFGKYVKDWNITAAGFVFRDLDHFMKVLDSEPYKRMEADLLEAAGMRFVLRNGARPGKPIISTRPVFTPDDLRGMKVRTPPWTSFIKTFEAMGAATVSIPWGETYLALRQGMAQVASATVSGFYGQSLHEVAPYMTMVDFFNDSFTIVISERRFQQLSAEHQQALMQAGDEAGLYYTEVAISDQAEILEKMVAEGAFLIYADPRPFVERMFSVVDDMEAEGVWETKGLYKQIQDVQ